MTPSTHEFLNQPIVFNDADDELVFADEISEEINNECWKVLIVDDEFEIHTATKLALKNFIFEDKSLNFISTYSANEAKELIQENSDTAIIILDVIMETDTAGLDFVKYVREVLGNQIVRIILRTGQPGHVPEKEVILNYDINDYKTKTELTRQKLYTTLLTALRSFTLSQKLQKEIEQRQQVEIALRESEQKEKEKAIALEKSFYQLQQAQLQLVQSEKMSSLGQLVAGVAHEINNPVNFINGNIPHAQAYIQQLIELLDLYQQHYPQPVAEIVERIEEIDLPFISDDLLKLLSSMHIGSDRIRNIVLSLRKFSHFDETEMKSVDIHEGIDSTLMILHHRIKSHWDRRAIEVIKEYGQLPLIPCYAGQLNQVFMNLLANSIDALEEQSISHKSETYYPQLRIRTEEIDDNYVSISIADNGLGMSEEIRAKVFASFFTTKPLGKGTGMGLSISRQIIVEKHGGEIKCISSPGEGTEFIIKLRKETVMHLQLS